MNAAPPMTGKAKLAVVRRISTYLFRYKGRVALCFALMLLSNFLALAAPKLSQKAIDAIELGVGRVDTDRVLFYGGIMLIFYIEIMLTL